MRNAHKILDSPGKRQLWRRKHTWEYNNKQIFKTGGL